jgi:hypothetical protein
MRPVERSRTARLCVSSRDGEGFFAALRNTPMPNTMPGGPSSYGAGPDPLARLSAMSAALARNPQKDAGQRRAAAAGF